MPRILARPKTELYESFSSDSAKLNEKNDCAVIAVAAVTGKPYAAVRELFLAEGRKPGKGTPRAQTRRVLEALGFKVLARDPAAFIRRYFGVHAGLKNVTTHHPDRFREVWADGKTYLFSTKGHILGVVNGTVHDWTRGTSKRVIKILEVVRK